MPTPGPSLLPLGRAQVSPRPGAVSRPCGKPPPGCRGQAFKPMGRLQLLIAPSQVTGCNCAQTLICGVCQDRSRRPSRLTSRLSRAVTRRLQAVVRVRFVSDMLLYKGFHDSRQIHRRFLHRVMSGIGDNFQLRIWEPRKVSVLHCFLRKSKVVFSDTY